MGSLIAAKETLTLFDLTQYFKHFGLVDEEATALMTVLGIIQRQNYIIEAMSGNGKTFLTNITLSLLPPERVYKWGLDTEAASFEANDELNKSWVIFITELQKFMGAESLLKTELLKDLGEDQSPGSKRRKMGVMKKGGERDIIEQTISGDKAIISTLAVENKSYKGDDTELSRRYPTLPMDVSPEHIQHIVDRQLDLEFKPQRLDSLTPDRVAAVMLRIQNAYQDELDIHNPVARAMKKYIPVANVQTPSYVNHLKNFMKAVTRFYSWRAFEYDGSLYTTVADIWELWQIYADMFWMSVNKVPFLGRRILLAVRDAETGSSKSSLDAYTTGMERVVTLKSIHRELTSKNLSLPYKSLKPLLTRMCDEGFLEKKDRGKGMEPGYTVVEDIKVLPEVDWKQVLFDSVALVEEVDGKEVAKCYLNHQLDNKGRMILQHPITGEEVQVI